METTETQYLNELARRIYDIIEDTADIKTIGYLNMALRRVEKLKRKAT